MKSPLRVDFKKIHFKILHITPYHSGHELAYQVSHLTSPMSNIHPIYRTLHMSQKMDGYPNKKIERKKKEPPKKHIHTSPPQIRPTSPLLPPHMTHPARPRTRIPPKALPPTMLMSKAPTRHRMPRTARPCIIRRYSQEPTKTIRHHNALARLAAPLCA